MLILKIYQRFVLVFLDTIRPLLRPVDADTITNTRRHVWEILETKIDYVHCYYTILKRNFYALKYKLCEISDEMNAALVPGSESITSRPDRLCDTT